MAEPEEKSAYQKYREEREAARAQAQGKTETAPAPTGYQQYRAEREAKRNESRSMRASLPGASGPDQMTNRTDSAVLAMRRKVEADIANATRKARVNPVEREAGRAGIAQLDQGPITANPNAAYSEFMLPPDAQRGMQAEREVYRENDVTSSVDAATIRGLNSAALGIPGIVNKDFRGELGAAGRDQPGASLAGDIAGFLIPGEAAWKGAGKAYDATIKPLVNALMPKGTSGLARGTRMTGRLAENSAGFAGQNALFQGSVGESTAAAEEGRAPSLGSAASRASTGLMDPINIAGPAALMGINRVLTFIRSGGATATPANVGSEISALTGGRVAAPNAPQSAASQVLDMGLAEADIRPQSVARVIRNLERAGMSREDITGLFESVQQRLSSLPEAQAGRLTLGQALLEALENPELSRAAGAFPQAAMQLRQTIRNASQGGPVGDVPRRGDQRAGIVSGVRRELQGSQTDFAQSAIDGALGDTSLISIDDLVKGAKREIGTAYDEVLRAADPTRPEARGIAMIVMGDGSAPGILKRRAENAGFESVEAYVAARPDEAGHWVRSALAKAGRSAKGREKIELDTTVAQLDELLETNEGYAAARKAYGTEIGVEDATEFGNRFIASSKNEYSVDLLMRELAGMSERERAVALSSIRNNLRSYLRGSQEDASAKISQLTNVGALNALEQLGPEGQKVADALRFLRREQGFLSNTTYGSDTARNLSAGQAEAFGNTPLQNVTGGQGGMVSSMAADALASTVSGNPTAVFTPLRIAGAGIKNVLAPRVSTLNDEVRFLMGRRGNIPDLPQSGTADFSPPPNALAPTASRLRTNEAGFTRTDIATTLAGGAAGYQAGEGLDLNGDGKINWEDRVAGVMYGVAGKYAAKPLVKSAVNALNPTYIPKLRPGDIEPPPMKAAERRYDDLRRIAEAEARKAGETLTPEQIKQRVDDEYRAFYKKDPPGMEQSPEMLAQGWQRSLRDAVDTLEKEMGPGNYTAYDVEREAITSFTDYYGSVRLPKDTLADADKLVPGTVDPSDLTPPPIRAAGFGGGQPKKRTIGTQSFFDERLTASENKAVEMRRNNMTTREIADEMDTSTEAVLVFIRNAKAKGVEVGAPSRDTKYTDVLALKAEGLSNAQIAERMGISSENVASVVYQAKKKGLLPSGLGALRGDLGNAGIGSLTGSAYGSQNDLNGDGKIDIQDSLRGSLYGAVGLPLGVRAVNALSGARRTVGSPRVASAGAGGGRKPPKPDSPEAIAAEVRKLASKKAPEPTRLEQMVEAGKDAAVPPINAMPTEAGAAGAKALRMIERGKTPLDIYDETGIALLPYNGANIPIMSSKMGPEELTRVFYGWLAEPPAKRPAWVQRIIEDAPKKKGLLLTERRQVAPPQANALAEPPLPPAGFPVGATALGAGAGIVTGVPAGIVGGTLMAREQDRKRNALAQ